MKTAFFGTPVLAVPYLEKLKEISDLRVVVTAPDKPAGRGYSMTTPAVKDAAVRLGVPVWQPETLKDNGLTGKLRALEIDIAIVVAYGKLIPQAALEIPSHGFINVHFSLLPKYRGAAPMQWALINGEKETGVTLFWLDEGMDTGPLFLQEKVALDPTDNGETLQAKLIPLGVRMMEEAIRKLEAGQKISMPQTGTATHAALLKKEDGQIDWNKSADVIVNLWRGLTPWPGIYTFIKHQRVKVLKAEKKPAEKGVVGTVVAVEPGVGPVIRCGEDALLLREVQPEGKRPMPAWAFWNGLRLKQGEKLG